MNRRLLLGFLAFAALALVGLEVPFGLTLTNDARTSHVAEVVSDDETLAYLVEGALAHGDTSSARSLLSHYASSAHAIVVVTEAGRPLLWAGAGVTEELNDPSARRILAAAAHGRTSGEEGSRDPDDDLLYAATPLLLHVATKSGGDDSHVVVVRGVLLVASSSAGLHAAIRRDVERLAGIGIALLLLAAIIGALLARSLTRPLAEIESVVAAHARGRLAVRADSRHGPRELRAHARTVNEMAGRVEELLGAQRAFVADAAHQLRSPLTALRLRLENLSARHDSDDAELGASIAEADRLSRVIDGLLALARADGARPPREAVDVVEVLHERVDAWLALASERGVDLQVEARRDHRRRLVADACRGFVDQVVDNLLANALDATAPGGTIRLHAVAVNEAVEVHVLDDGVGMSEVERSHAFDRFWRGPRARSEGTGLGLAIVAQLVRACGGTCRLDAGAAGGIDAVVRLPASREIPRSPRTRLAHGKLAKFG